MFKAQSEVDLLVNASLIQRVDQLTQALRTYDRGHPALQSHYGRLENGLRDWRNASLSNSQRNNLTHSTHAREREKARDAWSALLAAKPDVAYLHGLRPHAGAPGPLRIFVLLGGGGLGDALMYSAFLHELKRHLGPCEIVLGYGRPIVEALYKNSTDVECAVGAPWGVLQDVGETARWLGIFDLYVDIFCFLPRYHVCEGSRIDLDEHGDWLAGNMTMTDIIERFSSNLGMTILDRALKIHIFDILAAISGLPLDAGSPLRFTPDPKAIASVRNFGLPPLYVTVRDGASPGDLAVAKDLGADRTTKQLTTQKWAQVEELLRSLDVSIVQVGDSTDPTLDWVDHNLRGATSLSELYFVFKNALAHFDTEGGLVHFSRAAHTPAFVCFGTTSAAFFGYKGNVNLDSDACGCCWYTSTEWLGRCPRGRPGLECTDNIDLAPVKTGIATLRSRRLNRVRRISVAEPGSGLSAEAFLEWAAQKLPPSSDDTYFIRFLGDNDLDICEIFKLEDRELAPQGRSSLYNLPFETAALSRVLFFAAGWPSDAAQALEELSRLTAPTGSLALHAPTHDADDPQTRAFFDWLAQHAPPHGSDNPSADNRRDVLAVLHFE